MAARDRHDRHDRHHAIGTNVPHGQPARLSGDATASRVWY